MDSKHFDQAAATWDENPRRMALTRAIAEGVAEAVPLHGGMRMLEFGCGTGALSALLAGRVGEILCVDPSEGMIAELSRKLAGDEQLAGKITARHVTPPIEDQLDRGWDLICSAMVLHHLDDPRGVLAKLADLLNPGGRLAAADLRTEDGSFHGEHAVPHHGFDPDRLAAELREIGMTTTEVRDVLTFTRPSDDGTEREYSIFLLTATKP